MRLFSALLTAAALALPGLAQAQSVLFKNFSEVQVTGAVTAEASVNSHALIIFNSDYDHPGISDLPVTANDAQAVRRLFVGMGYPPGNITMVDNAPKDDLKRAVFDFTARLTDDSSVVVYYSGHGISFAGDARNYIVPVDLDPQVQGGARSLRERIFKDRAVNFNDDVLGTIKLAGPKGVVVFYDACRNSPIATDDATKAVGAEASFVPAKIQGTAMFYSARAGQTSLAALDSENDANLSVYTRVLVTKLAANPTMRLSDLHAVVQSDVSRLAREKAGGHRQHPVFEDELDYSRSDHNEFCLATVTVNGVARCTGRDEILTPGGGQVQQAAVGGSTTSTAPATPGVTAGGKADTERLYWESVKDSEDPREVQSYLDLYPQGFFAPIARLRVDKLMAALQAEEDRKAEHQATVAAEAAFWNSVKDMDDPEMIRLYIEQYPEGQFRPLAEARIAQIQNAAVNSRQAQAAQMYAQAQAADTQQAYQGYLNLYPAGEHASAVRAHLSRMQSLYQPSWCRGGASLNPTERAICDNYELGRLDQQLNEVFVTARAQNRTNNADQSSWRTGVRDACGLNPSCVGQVTAQRIAQLRGAAYSPARPSAPQSRYAACPAPTGTWQVQNVSTGDWLNIRAAAGSSSKAVGALAFNDTGVTVHGCQGNGWCRVSLGCASGWAFGKYLGEGRTVQNATHTGLYRVVDHPMDQLLNVRTGPGTEFPIVGELAPDATNIQVGDCQRVKGWKMRWCSVRHASGTIGWAYGQYLANQWGQKPS
ncbi:caspase family protein [Pseudooceanicola onchidii]|uniref:caspase family protein n=1 Tax=Pseudooceanicola onchidii TaxID=2562279 RepID=UPI0010A9BB1C|nr:caspase family protein [Pseudooceanicola onchidii]